jgi:cytidylate kinase
MESSAKIIAIDGPAASGKSTIGRLLAEQLGYLYFDTGVMYRSVTFFALVSGVAVEDQDAVTKLAEKLQIDIERSAKIGRDGYAVFVDGLDVTEEIRLPAVDAHVSVVSAYPGVRQALTIQQRRIGLRGRIVMVGRDVGTVVLPEADLKIFLDASIEERAGRRYLEAQQRGDRSSEQEILESMIDRDRIDSSRDIAPLKPAEDAIIVDTDGLSIEQVLVILQELVIQS